jgi:hypothetical protein
MIVGVLAYVAHVVPCAVDAPAGYADGVEDVIDDGDGDDDDGGDAPPLPPQHLPMMTFVTVTLFYHRKQYRPHIVLPHRFQLIFVDSRQWHDGVLPIIIVRRR